MSCFLMHLQQYLFNRTSEETQYLNVEHDKESCNTVKLFEIIRCLRHLVVTKTTDNREGTRKVLAKKDCCRIIIDH